MKIYKTPETSSVEKVVDSKLGGQGLNEKILLVLLDKALYLRVVLNNDDPSVSYYDYGLLKDLLAALDLDTQNYLY